MPDLIILRLHPAKPMPGDAFTDLLNGLQIKAFDLSFADPVADPDGLPAPVLLGQAAGLADPHLGDVTDNSVIIANTAILQHYLDIPDQLQPPPPAPPTFTRALEAVATVVIVAQRPATEYPAPTSFDLRLEMTRNGEQITRGLLDYNVKVVTVGGQVSKDQTYYFARPVSAYVTLPGTSLDPALAHVDLPPNGAPPPFDLLCKQIDKVLAKDPGAPNDSLTKRALDPLTKQSPLTPAQSRQVAAEIVWNRDAQPPPELPTDSLGLDPFGALYTHPAVDDVKDDDADKARAKFEAELAGWYGSRTAEELRLAGFVYSASAAIADEVHSLEAERARFDFPVETGMSTPGTIAKASVVLTNAGGLAPSFVVPAEYFYAIAASMPSHVSPQQRYDMARLTLVPRLLAEFEVAVDAGVIPKAAAAPFTAPGDPAVDRDQAARRLHALGGALSAMTEIPLALPIDVLVKDWLDHPGPVDDAFWAGEVAAQPRPYLSLLLEVVTENHAPLIAEIQAPAPGMNVASAAMLAAVTDKAWRELFLPQSPMPPPLPPRIDLLPPFTLPGTPAERTEAFIRHLRKFFAVAVVPPPPPDLAPGTAPSLGMPAYDAFALFAAAYPAHGGGAFTFGMGASPADIEATAADVFPGDEASQHCLSTAVAAIDALAVITAGTGELQFSLIEALYARGFTSASRVSALTLGEFEQALIGSVAYPLADTLYTSAGGAGGNASPPRGPFAPVNPDGSLTDCIPPQHLSPLGPIQYLYELLQVSAASTCDDPLQVGDPDRLELLLSKRRGPLGDLHATRANLETPLPRIDLVNESLEALAAQSPVTGGAIYDTADGELAGHMLATAGESGGDPYRHEPQTLFATLPEHSSPAIPVAEPQAYELLASDFSAPGLPYPQTLDVARSYIGHLGHSRFSTMRHFRKEITEFALDAAHEPAEFLRHLWRYPVRLETALEYLHISPEEYDLLYSHDIVDVVTANRLLLRELYGFPRDLVDGRPWASIVLEVPEFLERTGLSYCEFVDLWRAEFVSFQRSGSEGDERQPFPDCQPCCPDDLIIEFAEAADPLVPLRELAVFIRLWRRLQRIGACPLSFVELRDICEVLELFDDSGAINAEFLRQLAALLMLRDVFGLPLVDCDDTDGERTGANRTHLLALWAGGEAAKWEWAVRRLVESIEDRAEGIRPELESQPELATLLAENLQPLSRLAGFDPDVPSDTWHAKPTSTLRFAEVLLKIYVSKFTVGEVLFLFTDDGHLDGDDVFPLQSPNESLDNPLGLPDDDDVFGLWSLRGKLLAVQPAEEAADEWSWRRIMTAMHEEFGYTPPAGSDLLSELGEHFFPAVLEREGFPVGPAQTRFSAALPAAATTPLAWNTPPEGPFRYDVAAEELWTRLPLRNGPVAHKLSELRPLSAAEQDAVRDVFLAPRALLAPFAALFSNFGRAVDRLVDEEDDDDGRFNYFRHEFALFHERCRVIAEHLAGHVADTQVESDKDDEVDESGDREVAWRILRSLWADENSGLTPWEDDAGTPPAVTWQPLPSGGAFAALLGLTGTGALREFGVQGKNPSWRETRGPTTAFGRGRNRWNAPVPTVIPSMALTLTPQQQHFAVVRNGFALADADGAPLFGAQPFSARWRGSLLIEAAGDYRFAAGAPTPDGEAPDFEAAEGHRWRVTMRRGQRKWVLLNHCWPGEGAPDAQSGSLDLRRGVYEIDVELEQPEPTFDREEDVCPRHTGFQVKYAGPDSEGSLVAIPHDRLFRDHSDAPLDAGLGLTGSAERFLHEHYTGSLRDARRTYQRAFKATLFAHRFRLAAKPLRGDRESELGYLLDHADAFEGRSYYRTGAASFATHRALFDFNLLPVIDPYEAPPAAADERAWPSAKRQAALFDWWERIFDYDALRRETRKGRERPAWRLFYEAAERQPDDPAELLRHLGVDIRHAPSVLTFFDGPAPYKIQTGDLESEAWTIRAWQAEKWLRELQHRFYPRWIGDAQPALWASDKPDAPAIKNLTDFVQNGSFENGDPRRYEDIRRLDDGLRERARMALIAYLCGMDRTALPFAAGHFAEHARDLSDLLLQDVQSGICERASRIDAAVSAVQTFVQRARLGLEPSFPVSPAFVEVWDKRYASFEAFECCKQREVYRENWIEWDELRAARNVEAFRFLESELREAKLTVAEPGGMTWWPEERPPPHPSLVALQAGEPTEMAQLLPGIEGFDLLATPERDARPSLLAPLSATPGIPTGGGPEDPGHADDPPGDGDPDAPVIRALRVAAADLPAADLDRLPLWIQAAVKLGTRFVRVAAAGIPPATAWLGGCDCDCDSACCDCNCRREPLMDEYYFWLHDSRHFDAVVQEADVGVQPGDANLNVMPDATTDWHREDTLPRLLQWDPEPMVQLCWCRVHNGEFQPPRRSAGLAIDAASLGLGAVPELQFMGRTGDSLRFEVTGGEHPAGYLGTDAPGFRYDIPTDAAAVLPLVAPPPPPPPVPPPSPYPGGLDTYPFLGYFCPGAPVEPLSLFSVALAVGAALRTHCQFEAALKWYELVVDPLRADDTWAQCWTWEPVPDEPVPEVRAKPAKEKPSRRRRSPEGEQLDVALAAQPAAAFAHGGELDEPPPRFRKQRVRRHASDGDPCCPTGPVDDDVARNRAILLHFLETLLQWGDALRCRNTPEAFAQADVIFDTLARVLGRQPATIFGGDVTGDTATVSGFVPRSAPLNPRLMVLYGRTADRLALDHHCLNSHRLRNGRANVDMPYFGDSSMQDGWRGAACTCGDCDDWCLSCCDAYRFVFRVQKALELAGDVRSLGAELLSAYEKGDAEYLAALRSAQERQLLELALEIRQNQWRDADWQVQALKKTKEGAQARLRYYKTLIQNGLNAGELGYEALIGVSIASRAAGDISEAIAQGMGMVPDFWFGVAGIMGTPLEFQQMPLGNKLAAGFATAARIMNSLGEIANSSASLSLTEGGWDRREDEWRQQVDVIGIEIEQIERQILGAERRRDIALRELNNHELQIENSIEVQNFLRDKFTSHDLYLFLQEETAALYRQAYELASVAASQAERAFNYERGYTARSFLPELAWDSMREGLLAGERLQLAVRQMEKAYLDTNCREYELTKHVSLRLNFPLAFLHLQTTGACDIEIPEWMFDLDYPGQYMRRIKNVTLTIPAVVGPYAGVHCRLTLLSSTTRVDARLADPPVECCHPKDECCGCDPCCCGELPPNGYQLASQDSRSVRAYAATEAIATSSGQNDSGLFELSFRDERYLPFEFAGAVSRWRIELPPETNAFDFDSLSDVIMHVNYTAREGGDVLRAAAAEDARCRLPGNGLRLIDVRRDLSDAWYALQQTPDSGDERHSCRRLDLRLSDSMFPFVSARRVRWVDALQIFIEAPNAIPDTNFVLKFKLADHEHDHDEDCDCDRIDVHCIASSEWPGIFWGVLDLRGKRLGPLRRHQPAELGCLEFPDDLGEICGLQLLAGFCAEVWPRCGDPGEQKPCCGCCGRRGEEERRESEVHTSARKVRRGGVR
jgi:hypothetical protein